MKFSKISLLLGMIPLMLSCASSSITGRYGFQMGKETGTHFGIFLDLTKETYKEDEDVKKFNLEIKVGEGMNGDSDDTISAFMNIFSDENGNVIVPGYYQHLPQDKNKHGESRLKFGFDFEVIVNQIYNKAKQYAEEEGGVTVPEGLDEINALNDNDIIQAVIYGTYKNSTVNLYIPVSFDDLYYQLYWYGIDIKVSINTDPNSESTLEVNVVKFDSGHKYGDTPTAKDVEEINKTFADEHQNCMFTSYRMFHQVKMGLLKM